MAGPRSRKRKREQRSKAHDESALNRLSNQEEQDDYNDAGDLRVVMASPHGRRFVARLLADLDDNSGLPVDGYGRGDPLASAFFQGQRQVAADLNEEVQTLCPDEWVLMQAERLRKAEEQRSSEEDDRDE